MGLVEVVCAVLLFSGITLLGLSMILHHKGKEKPAQFSLMGGIITAFIGLAISCTPAIMSTIDSIVTHSCANCGGGYEQDNTHYCNNCGYAINPIKSTCECGKDYYANDNATFCTDCGNEIK